MDPEDYIRDRLQNCGLHALTETDQAVLRTQGIEKFIYAKLTSGKFRKWAIGENTARQVKRAIALNVSRHEPIKLRYPFGGYKLWRMPSSPEVDWAEFFALAYYAQYIAPIAAGYEPGIELVFTSDDVIMERMNNIPKAHTEAYFTSFEQLVRQFHAHFPPNLTMTIIRIGDLYDDEAEMDRELVENIARFERSYATTIDESTKQKMYTTSKLNMCWDGAADLTELDDRRKRALIERGPIYHDAYCALSRRQAFNRAEDKIVIFAAVIPNSIALGTTKNSVTKFWTGFGMLDAGGPKFADTILSPSQLAATLAGRLEQIPIRLFGIPNLAVLPVRR